MKILVFGLLLLFSPRIVCIEENDLVTLPDVDFIPNFNTYAGYLNANEVQNRKMFYFLTESKSNASTDPLIIWFNGGPGCSSFSGQFKELGPFYARQGGKTLFENPYSWNAKANVLFLESPIGVGFSYDTKVENMTDAGDDQSAQQNYNAIKDFFIRVQPKYLNRTFFVAGESYAAVYVPQLVKLMVEGINNGEFPNKNLQGMAVGNGCFSDKTSWNSQVLFKASRGFIGPQELVALKKECKTGNETDFEKYNYMEFMKQKGISRVYEGDNSTCGRLLDKVLSEEPAGEEIDFDIYNIYQDCYQHGNGDSEYSTTKEGFNYYSTDQLGGYKCYFRNSSAEYINRPDVLKALKIDKEWRKRFSGTNKWNNCNKALYRKYQFGYPDVQPFFDYIIKNQKIPNFRILVFSGDVDTVCNFVGVSWFIEKVAKANNLKSSDYAPWLFAKQLAGYAQRYSNSNLNLDVLTVKGAGHFVPVDRPGAALQMINNFLFSTNKDVHKQYSNEMSGESAPKVSILSVRAFRSTGHRRTYASDTKIVVVSV